MTLHQGCLTQPEVQSAPSSGWQKRSRWQLPRGRVHAAIYGGHLLLVVAHLGEVLHIEALLVADGGITRHEPAL